MRGADITQEGLFSTRTTAEFVPADHPLIGIRQFLSRALIDPDVLFQNLSAWPWTKRRATTPATPATATG